MKTYKIIKNQEIREKYLEAVKTGKDTSKFKSCIRYANIDYDPENTKITNYDFGSIELNDFIAKRAGLEKINIENLPDDFEDIYVDKNIKRLTKNLKTLNFKNLTKEDAREAQKLIELITDRHEKVKQIIEAGNETLKHIHDEIRKYKQIKDCIVQ
jgi:hypothetical protein